MGEIGGKIIRLLSHAAIDLLLIFADLGREVGRHEAFNSEPPLIVFTQLLGACSVPVSSPYRKCSTGASS